MTKHLEEKSTTVTNSGSTIISSSASGLDLTTNASLANKVVEVEKNAIDEYFVS